MEKSNDHLVYMDICPVCRWTTIGSKKDGHRTDCSICKDNLNKNVPQIQIEVRIPELLLGNKPKDYPIAQERRQRAL